MNMMAPWPDQAGTGEIKARMLPVAAIAQHSSAWRALGEQAFVPAGAALQGWLEPALRHLSPGFPAELLTLWRLDRLCGVIAMKPGRGLLWRSWTSLLSFSGTPLIARDDPKALLKALLDAGRGRAIQLSAIPASGPFWDMLGETVAEAGGSIAMLDRWERAALAPKGSFEQWFTSNFDRKRRKEYRRLRTRLGEEGTLDITSWDKGDPVDPWVDDLMALEARGWKGRRGTALATNEAMATAYREALHLLAAEGNLRFWKVVFNGKPIAMMSGLVSGARGWLGKVAYDEDFAKYSPGVQVILAATETLIDKDRLTLVDSCAIPDHPMINNIWRDRVAFCDVLIKGPSLSTPVFAAALAAEKARRKARIMAKTLYYRISRRQKS